MLTITIGFKYYMLESLINPQKPVLSPQCFCVAVL